MQRWEPYIIKGMLFYPVNDDGELVVPDDNPVPRPPDEKPGKLLSFTKKGVLPASLITVGDESEQGVKYFAKRHGISEKGYKRTKPFKKPLRNFNRDFRWYKIYQEKIKDRGAKTKGSILSEIFFEDKSCSPDDWTEYIEKTRNDSDSSYSLLNEDVEIKAINRIRSVIYRLDKIVYEVEK